MKFTCNQDWDTMEPTSTGRFCDICRKNVIDYTNSSLDKILKDHHSNGGNICGLFNTEQIDPSIISPIKKPFSSRFLVFMTTFTLGFTTKVIQAQTQKPKIEQYQTSNSTATQEDSIAKTIENHTCNANCGCKKSDSATSSSSNRNINRKKYFLSRRFPFIVRRRTRTMGRFL